MGRYKITRRDFLRFAAVSGAGMVVAACGGTTEAPQPPAANQSGGEAATSAPQTAAEATTAPEAAAADTGGATEVPPTPTRAVPRGQAKDVAREKSLILMWNISANEVGVGNPYAAGHNHQSGTMAMWEPLYFYSAYADKYIPWLADGDYQYNADYTEVTIPIRKGAEWSDGQPFTASDVAFTLNALRKDENAAAPYAADMKKWVKDASAPDANTVKITFTQPAPRFLFDFFHYKFDLGLFILPEHIFKDEKDLVSSLFYDPAKGWPVTTGPYKVMDWTAQQKLMDVRPDWWAVKTGFQQLPKPERIAVVPFPTGDATPAAQAMINNEIDTSLDLRPPVIKTVVEQNPKVITHTGRKPPYGYTDWWPNSLWFNCSIEPYNDPDIRMAVNYAIDRDQVIEIGYEGAGTTTDLPFPAFPSLQKYFDAAKPLLEKYPTSANDPSKTEEIMTGKGYTKNGDGLWVSQDGKTVNATIYGFDIFADYGPVLAEQLHNAGFDASFQAPPDAGDRMANGSALTFLYGHGGAIADVYPTLDLFHSRHISPNGTIGDVSPRWKNEEYDKIVDQLAQLPVGDPKGMPLYLQALEIYLKEKPELPILQWYHRIPMNTTYWTNWPTADNPYINGAFWHKTFILMLINLQPAT